MIAFGLSFFNRNILIPSGRIPWDILRPSCYNLLISPFLNPWMRYGLKNHLCHPKWLLIILGNIALRNPTQEVQTAC